MINGISSFWGFTIVHMVSFVNIKRNLFTDAERSIRVYNLCFLTSLIHGHRLVYAPEKPGLGYDIDWELINKKEPNY